MDGECNTFTSDENLSPWKRGLGLYFRVVQAIGMLPFPARLLFHEKQEDQNTFFTFPQIQHYAMFVVSSYLVGCEIFVAINTGSFMTKDRLVGRWAFVIGFTSFLFTTYFTILFKKQEMLIVYQTCARLSKLLPPQFWWNFIIATMFMTFYGIFSFIFIIYNWNIQYTFISLMQMLFHAFGSMALVGFSILFGNVLLIFQEILKYVNQSLRKPLMGELTSVVKLTRLHEEITNCCFILNSTYNPILLSFFFLISGGSFYTSVSIIAHGFANSERFWLFLYAWTLLYVLNATSSTRDEAAKTTTILMARPEAENNFKMVEPFCYFQLHKGLEFTAYSFFVIDWEIAVAIVGMVLTYTIISLQLQTSY